MLVLGEGEAHGVELAKPGGAAVLAAAAPDAGEPGGLIADPDLAELDAGAKMACEVADERAEVDPLLGGEVDGELVAVPLPLGIAHFHPEVVPLDPLHHRATGVLLLLAELVVLADLVLRGPAHHLGLGVGLGGVVGAAAGGTAAAALLGGGLSGALDAAEVEAAIGLHDDRLLQAEGVFDVEPAVEPAAIAFETDLDELHQASVTTPIPANFSARRRTSFSGFTDLRSFSWRMRVVRRVSAISSVS